MIHLIVVVHLSLFGNSADSLFEYAIKTKLFVSLIQDLSELIVISKWYAKMLGTYEKNARIWARIHVVIINLFFIF